MSNALPVDVIAPDGTVMKPGGWERGLGGRRRVALFGLVVVLVAGTVGFGVSRLFTAAGGAQSPESAVRELLSAVEAGDMTAAVSTLRPIEAETLVEPALEMVDELQRLGLVDPDADPTVGGEGGSGVSFGGVELSTEQINDRVAFVGLDGEVTGPSGGLPLGPLGELLPLPGGARGPSEAISLPPDAGLAVVVEDGRSYVSLWYTVAEMARRSSGLGPPPAPLLAPRPSDTPDGVGAALLDAVATDDVEAALALVDPVEGAAVYDYSGLYLPTLGTSGTAPADEDFSFDEATVTAEVDGELARVTLALTGVDAALQLPPGLAGAGTGAVPSDVSIDIIAVEREDGWYLSPGRSVTDALLGFLAGLDDEDLEGLLASLLGLDLPFAGPSTELPTADSLEPAPVEAGPAEFVPIDAPEVLALREKLPLDVPGVQTLGHFDDAFRRAGDLSVTRVYGLAIGFADATITETEAPDGEPIVERFGDDVVIVGQRGGLEITVSVFGLADADAETVASSLYQAIADRA